MSTLPYTEEHHALRETARRFIDREIKPYYAQWEKDGAVPRELDRTAGKLGLLLAAEVPVELVTSRGAMRESTASAGTVNVIVSGACSRYAETCGTSMASVMSSTIFARCGNTSESSLPLCPCFANLKRGPKQLESGRMNAYR